VRKEGESCVTGEEAENGLQRTVKQSSRSKAKNRMWLKLRRSEMKSEQQAEMVSKLYQNEQVDLRNIILETRVVGWC
jgi:hypothetical protein